LCRLREEIRELRKRIDVNDTKITYNTTRIEQGN
jgi:hypothetical protein